ncbi:MAG: cobalt-precorrin-5B (C(1))-methyltransferase [Pseudomonadota bacterium]
MSDQGDGAGAPREPREPQREREGEAASSGSRGAAGPTLRTGFTTGACATAAAAGAARAIATGRFPETVEIRLPRGQRPQFALVDAVLGQTSGSKTDAVAWPVPWARAAVVKDAGDDPDVTHGSRVQVTLRPAPAGAGVVFRAGEGVGRITKPGLPLPPGEPAINPVPRAMITEALRDAWIERGPALDVEVEVAIPGGRKLAERTWNPRLGIEGGLSILGTTGIVRPFSCAAWIASIHRGVDVARESGAGHVAGATGATSERVAQGLHRLPDWAMLDMGDFAGGLLKYLRDHHGGVIRRLTLAGGFAKLTKLSQGALDLHSGRSQVDFAALEAMADGLGGPAGAIRGCNTAAQALELMGPPLARRVAHGAQKTAIDTLAGAPVEVEVLIVDRSGAPVAQTAFRGPD